MKAKQLFPTVNQVRQLPASLSLVVPPEWEDLNGHVNVQYYLTLYERAGWPMLESIGFDQRYIVEKMASIFDVEHHIRYLAEINVGDTVSVHNSMLSYNDKLFQGMFFIVNDTQDKLASTIEYLSVHIDMKQRRSTSFSQGVAARLDELCKHHASLNCPIPVSGLMDL